ncbi:Uncharacterised protein [Mycobacterium tuberculosis]|nr:Uncharacterised protein [Mycobacterium tuberculosis]
MNASQPWMITRRSRSTSGSRVLSRSIPLTTSAMRDMMCSIWRFLASSSIPSRTGSDRPRPT